MVKQHQYSCRASYKSVTEEVLQLDAFVNTVGNFTSSLLTTFYVICQNTGTVAVKQADFHLDVTWGDLSGAFLTLDQQALINFSRYRDYSRMPRGFSSSLDLSLADSNPDVAILPGESFVYNDYYAGWLNT